MVVIKDISCLKSHSEIRNKVTLFLASLILPSCVLQSHLPWTQQHCHQHVAALGEIQTMLQHIWRHFIQSNTWNKNSKWNSCLVFTEHLQKQPQELRHKTLWQVKGEEHYVQQDAFKRSFHKNLIDPVFCFLFTFFWLKDEEQEKSGWKWIRIL